MGINLGSAGIANMFVGSTNILRAYQGAVQVFPTETVFMAQGIFTTPATTGNIQFTTPDLNGLTPKAAIVVCGYSDSLAAETPEGFYSVGFTDGLESFNHFNRINDNLSTSAARRSRNADADSTTILRMFTQNTANNEEIAASFVQFVTNGIELNFTNVFASAPPFAHIIFFAGDGLSAFHHRGPVVNGTETITSYPFAPELVLASHNATDGSGFTNSIAHAPYSFGAAKDDGSTPPQQFSVARIDQDGLGTTAPQLVWQTPLSPTVAIQASLAAFSQAYDNSQQLQNFSVNGYQMVHTGTFRSAMDYSHLGFAFDGVNKGDIRTLQTPTSGNLVVNVGFKPAGVIIFATTGQADVDAGGFDNANAHSFSIGAMTPGGGSCYTISNLVGVGTTSTRTFAANDAALQLLENNAGHDVICKGSLVQFTSTGWEMSFSPQAPRLMNILAITLPDGS